MNIVYRCGFAFNLSTTIEGKSFPTGIIYGFLSSLRALMSKYSSEIVICWDSQSVWRKKIVSTYKASRASTPEQKEARAVVFMQLPVLEKFIEVLGFMQFRVDGLEADDLIGIFSQVCQDHKSVNRVWIYSTDADFYQLISKKVRVLRPLPKNPVAVASFDLAKSHGLRPDQWAEYKALSGDSSDNYKSVAGIGPARASAMILAGVTPSTKRFAKLTSQVKKAYPQLEQHWDNVHKCWQLAVIPRDTGYSLLPSDCREVVQKQLYELRAYLKCGTLRCMSYAEKRKRYLEFVRLCSDYEMTSLLASRREFFEGVRVV